MIYDVCACARCCMSGLVSTWASVISYKRTCVCLFACACIIVFGYKILKGVHVPSFSSRFAIAWKSVTSTVLCFGLSARVWNVAAHHRRFFFSVSMAETCSFSVVLGRINTKSVFWLALISFSLLLFLLLCSFWNIRIGDFFFSLLQYLHIVMHNLLRFIGEENRKIDQIGIDSNKRPIFPFDFCIYSLIRNDSDWLLRWSRCVYHYTADGFWYVIVILKI